AKRLHAARKPSPTCLLRQRCGRRALLKLFVNQVGSILTVAMASRTTRCDDHVLRPTCGACGGRVTLLHVQTSAAHGPCQFRTYPCNECKHAATRKIALQPIAVGLARSRRA